jgi:hypothetical protein
MACAALRLLQNRLRAKGGYHGANLPGLMSDDNKQLRGFKRLASAYDMLDQRASPGAMEDLREVGTHARPLAGG